MASPDPERRLLALVYQHLLQVGYKEAAQELRKQSGEKLFTSQTVSLLDIYKEWSSSPGTATKRKAAKADQTPQTKKVRVCDPVSSSEVSDEEETQQLTSNKASSNAKSVHTNLTLKPEKIEKEKTAKKSKKKEKNATAAVKDAISVPTPVVNKAAAAELNRSKVSTPSKPTTVLKKAEASESSSEESSDSEDELTIPESKQTPVTVTTADAKEDGSSNSSGENSDSSDEKKPSTVAQTKVPAKSAATIGTKAATVKNGTPVSAKVKSSSLATASKIKPPTKLTATVGTKASPMKNGTLPSGEVKSSTSAPASKEESSESSDSSESEDEEPPPSVPSSKKTAKVETSKSNLVKATPSKSNLAPPESSKGSTVKSKITPIAETEIAKKIVTPAKAVGKLEQQAENSECTESSESEDEDAAAPASEVKTARPTPASIKSVQGKGSTPITKSAALKKDGTMAKVPGTPMQQKEESSSSSESSDSEDQEPPAKSAVKATPQVTPQVKTTLLKSSMATLGSSKGSQAKATTLTPKIVSAPRDKGKTPGEVAGIVTQHAASSDESESSDSEDEEETTSIKSPVKATPPVKSFANSTSQKSHKDSPVSKSIQGKASILSTKPSPVKGTTTAKTTVTVVQPSGSSDSSDSSESEDEEVATQTKVAAKATPPVCPQVKIAALKSPLTTTLFRKIAQVRDHSLTPNPALAAGFKGMTPAKAAVVAVQQNDCSVNQNKSISEDTDKMALTKSPVKSTPPLKSLPNSTSQKSHKDSPASIKSKQGKASVLSSKPAPAKGTVKAAATAVQQSGSSDGSDSSESEDEEVATKTKVAAKATQPVSPQVKAAALKSPLATPLSRKIAQVRTLTPKPALAAEFKGMTPAKTTVVSVQQNNCSGNQNISISEDVNKTALTKALAKATPAAKPNLLKGPAANVASRKGNVSTPASKTMSSTPGKKVTSAKAAQQSESSGTSESSESDNEMQTEAAKPAAKIAPQATPTAKSAPLASVTSKKPAPVSTRPELSSKPVESSDDSDTDKEEYVSQKSIKVPPVKTTTPAKVASIVPSSEWQISGSENSDSSSSEDEKDTARKKTVPIGASGSLVKGTQSGTLTQQVAKDESSSEDSSEDSAEEKMNLTQKDPVMKSSQPVVKTAKTDPPAKPVKQGKTATPAPANLAQSKAVPSKTETPKAKPSKEAVSASDERSDSSESEDEVMPTKTSDVKQAPTKKELPSSSAKKSGNKEINHASSNSSDETSIPQSLLTALSLKPSKTTAAKSKLATPKITSTINGKEAKSTKPSVKVTAAEDSSDSDTDAEAEKQSNQSALSKKEVVPTLSTQPNPKAKIGEKAPSKRKAVESSGETPNVTSAKKAKQLSQNSQSSKGNTTVKSAEALLSLAEPDEASSISNESENENTTAAKAKSLVVASGDASSDEETRKILAAKAVKRKAKAVKKETKKNKSKKLKLAGDRISMILPGEKSGKKKKKKKLDKKNKLKKKKKLSTKTPYLLGDSEQNAPNQEDCSPFLQKKKKKKKAAKAE